MATRAAATVVRRRHRVVWAALGLAFASFAAGGKKRRTPPEPPDLPARVNQLVLELYGVPLDESAPIATQIQQLVLGDLIAWLRQHPPSGESADVPYEVQVRREMESAFSKLHAPFVAEPAAFARPWKGGTLIGAAYMLGWSDQDRTNVVALYQARAGDVRLAAVTSFVPGAEVHFAFPAAPGAASFDFLVYGTRLGKSHPRLSAVLYAFDGQTLAPTWKSIDNYDGTLSVEGDRIVIRYLQEQEFIQATEAGGMPPRYEAVYRVTPQGVDLLRQQTLPDR